MTEVVEDAAAATPGQRLKAARERRGLSSQKAADQMHLDPWVIEALESDQLDKIGPSVYAKGHLKRYAGMLGLPPADIMAAAYGVPAAAAGSASPRGGMRMRTQEAVGSELPWSVIFGGAAAAALILGAMWLRPWQPRIAAAPRVPSDQPPASQLQTDGRVAGGARVPGSATAEPATEGVIEDGEDSAAAALPVAASVAVAARGPAIAAAVPVAVAAGSAPTAVPIPGAGKVRLRLSFSADSRVEVRDANGNPIFAGNGRANSVKTLAGDAPLRVYLGFASGVQLAVNNRVVAIGPQFVAGDVARFEAGADGVLRRDTHTVRSSAATPQSRPRG